MTESKINCQETMKKIEMLYGPFDQGEIDFYLGKVDKISKFQKKILFNMFYKYFGDPVALEDIDKIQYVKLIIVFKNMLQADNMVIMPYIVSSKIVKLVNRKIPNKNDVEMIESSAIYQDIIRKYKNKKIEKDIMSTIATILSSKFEMMDYYCDEVNGREIDMLSSKACEEILVYISKVL